MSVVFLTGATGFIGKELTKQLVQNGHTILALVRSPGKWKGFLANLTPDEQKSCMALAGDMKKERLGLSSSDYEQVLGANVIIHTGVPMDISLEESVAREVILEGTTHLIALAKEIHQKNGLEKLIHIVGYMSPFDNESGKFNTDVFAPTELFKNAPPHAPTYPAFLKRPVVLRKMLQMNVTARRLESFLLEQGVFQTKEEIPPNYLEKVGGLLQSPRIMKSHMDVLAYFMGDFTNISDHLPTGIPAHVIWGTRDKVYHLSREAENAFTQSNGKVELLDLGHHFPISHPKLTAEALTSLRNGQ